MNITMNPKQHETVEHQVSYRDGYHYFFAYGQTEIHAHGNAVTGKETIYVNNELVSSKRSLGTRSCHKFTIDGQELEVEFHMANILKGEVHCTLIHNNTHLETQKLALKDKYQINDKTILFWLPLSGLIGILAGYQIVTLLESLL